MIDHDHPSGLFDVFIASVENVVFVVSVVSVVADIKVRFEALAATDDLEFVAAQQKKLLLPPFVFFFFFFFSSDPCFDHISVPMFCL